MGGSMDERLGESGESEGAEAPEAPERTELFPNRRIE
jgi:hypothetical protein